MLKLCKYCSTSFEAKEKEIKRGNAKYCGKKCFDLSRVGPQPKVENSQCSHCGKTFYRSNSRLKNSKSGHQFCNRTCKEQAQKLGGIKEIMPSHYGEGKAGYRELFTLSELICSRCGYKEFPSSIDIHHIDKDRSNNDKKNLIPLCSCCHRALHNKQWIFGGLV